MKYRGEKQTDEIYYYILTCFNMEFRNKSFVFLVFFTSCISVVSSLECYVCDRQEDNNGKCAKTVQQCGRDEDWCLSIIRWGSMPYWTQGAPKQFFISKMCATRETCERTKRETLPKCERIWYNDWTCSECCQGDRCNFFITLGSTSLNSNYIVLFVSSVLACFYAFTRTAA